jgi:hypothetical protein
LPRVVEDGGVVDEGVDVSVRLLELGGDGVEGVWVVHVERSDEGPLGVQSRRRGVPVVDVSAAEDDEVAAGDQLANDGKSDAAVGAGDDDDPVHARHFAMGVRWTGVWAARHDATM